MGDIAASGGYYTALAADDCQGPPACCVVKAEATTALPTPVRLGLRVMSIEKIAASFWAVRRRNPGATVVANSGLASTARISSSQSQYHRISCFSKGSLHVSAHDNAFFEV